LVAGVEEFCSVMISGIVTVDCICLQRMAFAVQFRPIKSVGPAFVVQKCVAMALMFFLSALETCSFRVSALLNANMRLQNIRLEVVHHLLIYCTRTRHCCDRHVSGICLSEFPYQSALDESLRAL